jgi:ABC-type nitrate/sulfonate/bicarbonate transport system substrate-binding protein
MFKHRLSSLLSVPVLAATIALGVVVPSGSVSAQEKVLRLGIQPAPILEWVVKEKQLLEKRGFKTEWTVFPYAAPELEAMAAGSIDMAVMGTLPIVMVAMKDPDIWYFYDTLGNGSGMVVAADSGIQEPADLKGKKIAFPGKASQQYGLLMSYLGAAGISDTELELYKANAPDMTTLLQKGEVDGFLAWAPFTSEAVRTGLARSLWTSDDLHKIKAGHWLNAGWAVRADFARENEDAVIALVEALHEATNMLRDEPEEVSKVFATATGLAPEVTRYTTDNHYFVYFDPADTMPTKESIQEMFAILTQHGVVKDVDNLDAVLDNFVHPEFVQKVLAKQQ